MILHGEALLVGAGLQAKDVTRMIIDDGQRMTVGAVGERHVTLEVHLPQQIGSLLLEAVSRVGWRILRRLDPAVPAQDLMDRGRRRNSPPVPLQTVHNLASPPSWMLVANGQHAGFRLTFTAAGHRMRTT